VTIPCVLSVCCVLRCCVIADFVQPAMAMVLRREIFHIFIFFEILVYLSSLAVVFIVSSRHAMQWSVLSHFVFSLPSSFPSRSFKQ